MFNLPATWPIFTCHKGTRTAMYLYLHKSNWRLKSCPNISMLQLRRFDGVTALRKVLKGTPLQGAADQDQFSVAGRGWWSCQRGHFMVRLVIYMHLSAKKWLQHPTCMVQNAWMVTNNINSVFDVTIIVRISCLGELYFWDYFCNSYIILNWIYVIFIQYLEILKISYLSKSFFMTLINLNNSRKRLMEYLSYKIPTDDGIIIVHQRKLWNIPTRKAVDIKNIQSGTRKLITWDPVSSPW